MKVEELIKKLQDMPPETPVYILDEKSDVVKLVKGVEYSDTLGEDEGDGFEGIIIGNHEIF